MKNISLFLIAFSFLFATIINVPDDQPTIQAGIDASADGDTVLVQPGTYVENINFNGHNIVLGTMFIMTGDTSFISQTIIDGDSSGSVVTFESDEDSTTVLSGFTIMNGWTPQDEGGGGIYSYYSNPTLKYLLIKENSVIERGGGLYLYWSNSNLDNITIRNNTSSTGGGINLRHSNSNLTNIIIKDNTATWVGGGLWIEDDSNPVLNNVVISGNTCTDTGLGGGIYCFNSNPIIINSTIIGNLGSAGGGIYCSACNPNFMNTILYNNIPQEIFFFDSEGGGWNWNTFTIFYSDVQGGESNIVTNNNGTVQWLDGNIDADPLFNDSGAGDYTLQIFSPCIDAGNPDSQYNDPDGTRNDMGAFPFSHIFGCTDPIALNCSPEATYDDGSCVYDNSENHSLSFDGIDDFVNFANSDLFGLTESQHLTIMFYIKPLGFDFHIVNKYENLNPSNCDFYISITPGGDYVITANGTNVGNFSSADIGQWQHITVVFESPSNNLFYKNGSYVGSVALNYSSGISTEDLTLGAMLSQGNPDYLNGLVDDLQIWSRPLNATEIQTNIFNDPDTNDPDLIGYWNFNEGTGDLVFDRTGNLNHGIINGSSWSEDVIVLGCTNPAALNYNPDSNFEDGSCEYGPDACIDIDGNYYQTVVIGNQEWMAENLKVTQYNNGDPIPTGYSDSEWGGLSFGAYCIYPWDDDEASQNTCYGNCAEVYGNLYNWYAVDDDRGICPEDFHVPSDEEWMELEMFLGMSYEDAHDTGYRGTNQGSQLAGNADLWSSGILENDPAFGSSGYLALPGGLHSGVTGWYDDMNFNSPFWSSTAYSSTNVWFRNMTYSYLGVYRSNSPHPHTGFAIRCLRDEPIMGCTDDTACNYNPIAIEDDGSCLYMDCNNECGGTAYLDQCSDCVGGSTGFEPGYTDLGCGCDEPGPLNYCYDFDGDDLGDPGTSSEYCLDTVPEGWVQDCTDTCPNGDVTIDYNTIIPVAGEIQISYTSNVPIYSFEVVFSGITLIQASNPILSVGIQGNAIQGFSLLGDYLPAGSGMLLDILVDNFPEGLIQIASAATVGADYALLCTTYPPSISVDCHGDIDGTAFIDDCGYCSGGNTDHEANSDKDICGVCPDNSNAPLGYLFGDGPDCNGDCFGSAFIDLCGVCSEGLSGHIENSDDLGCGCFSPAPNLYYFDEDGDNQGSGNGVLYCAEIAPVLTPNSEFELVPENWVLEAGDPCPQDNPNDSDEDGVCDSNDICPDGNDTIDLDGDGIPDDCDECLWNSIISVGDIDVYTSTIEIVYLSDVNIYGFQFSMSGITVLGAYSDHLNTTTAAHQVTGYTLFGNYLPAGQGVLVTVTYSHTEEVESCFGNLLVFTSQNTEICSTVASNCFIVPDTPTDCFGTFLGDALSDDCGICSGGLSGHTANSDIDVCNVCPDGTYGLGGDESAPEGYTYGDGPDCNEDCFGSAFLDTCGICSGGESGNLPDNDTDCNGDCFGTAYINECGCVEGETGLETDWCYGCTLPQAANYCPDCIFSENNTCLYWGDINGDGNLNVIDVVAIVEIILFDLVPALEQLLVGDLDNNGELNIIDLVMMVDLIIYGDLNLRGSITSSSVTIGADEFTVKADGSMAGIQLEVGGNFILGAFNQDGWQIRSSKDRILIYSIDGSEVMGDIIVPYAGEINISSAIIVDWSGNGVDPEIQELPQDYSIRTIYPNPFNPVTTVEYELPKRDLIEINILNIRGEKVKTLLSKVQNPGLQSIHWNAENEPSGIYFVQLTNGGVVEIQKVLLLK